jgi:hypothetical protein
MDLVYHFYYFFCSNFLLIFFHFFCFFETFPDLGKVSNKVMDSRHAVCEWGGGKRLTVAMAQAETAASKEKKAETKKKAFKCLVFS